MSTRIWLRRAYDPPTRNDGRRVLVDRLWPRGLRRDDAALTEWVPAVAPSDALRTWFGHDPARFEDFAHRYRSELVEHRDELDHLVSLSEQGRVTLVYAARDRAHNNTVVLRRVLEERLAQRARRL